MENRRLWATKQWVVATLLLGAISIILVAIKIANDHKFAAARESDCQSHLYRIAFFLEQYKDEHGEYPPPVVRSETGDALYSWRVLLADSLRGDNQVSELLRPTEPWDSPANRQVRSLMPVEFCCPNSTHGSAWETHYFLADAATLPKGVAEKVKPMAFGSSGNRNVLVVECEGLGVDWMQPLDVQVDFTGRKSDSKVLEGHRLMSQDPRGAGIRGSVRKSAQEYRGTVKDARASTVVLSLP